MDNRYTWSMRSCGKRRPFLPFIFGFFGGTPSALSNTTKSSICFEFSRTGGVKNRERGRDVSPPVDGMPNGVPMLSVSEGAAATFGDGHRCQHCGN